MTDKVHQMQSLSITVTCLKDETGNDLDRSYCILCGMSNINDVMISKLNCHCIFVPREYDDLMRNGRERNRIYCYDDSLYLTNTKWTTNKFYCA